MANVRHMQIDTIGKVLNIAVGVMAVVTFCLAGWRFAHTDTSTYLGFVSTMLGSLFGAIFAVLGAIWFEQLRRSEQRSDDLAAIKGALEKLDAATDIATSWKAEPGAAGGYENIKAMADGIEIVRFVLRRADIHDQELWLALIDLLHSVDKHGLDLRGIAKAYQIGAFNYAPTQRLALTIRPMVLTALSHL